MRRINDNGQEREEQVNMDMVIKKIRTHGDGEEREEEHMVMLKKEKNNKKMMKKEKRNKYCYVDGDRRR